MNELINFNRTDIINKMMDNLFNPIEDSFWHIYESNAPCKLEKTDDSYNYEIVLAGFDKKDIEAKIDEKDGMAILSIKAENKKDKFNYSCILPKDIDLTKVKSNLDKGILTINFAQNEKTKTKHIPIDIK